MIVTMGLTVTVGGNHADVIDDPEFVVVTIDGQGRPDFTPWEGDA